MEVNRQRGERKSEKENNMRKDERRDREKERTAYDSSAKDRNNAARREKWNTTDYTWTQTRTEAKSTKQTARRLCMWTTTRKNEHPIYHSLHLNTTQ